MQMTSDYFSKMSNCKGKGKTSEQILKKKRRALFLFLIWEKIDQKKPKV